MHSQYHVVAKSFFSVTNCFDICQEQAVNTKTECHYYKDLGLILFRGAQMHLFGKINSSEGVLFLTGGDHSFLKVEFTSNLRPLYIIQLNRKNVCKNSQFFTILLSWLSFCIHYTLYKYIINYTLYNISVVIFAPMHSGAWKFST